jgi:hypothetical protein
MIVDRVQMVVDIQRLNRELLAVCHRLMGAEAGSEEAHALTAVADAVACLELYLYPESRWSDDEKYLDDGN